jgi:two-component system C4-dicarboxylate transport response regulator DctD
MSDPRVLFVDDDEAMRVSTAQALDLAGFRVEPLGTADEALALVGKGFAGVVVSDIRMPGTDGMTLLSRIREIDPEIPVILVTGHAEVPLAVEAIRGGAYDFIEKPFVVQELAILIRRAWEHRALVLENRRLRAVAGKRGAAARPDPGHGRPALPGARDRRDRRRHADHRPDRRREGGGGAHAP